MALHQIGGSASLIDVLDRILDKSIVIDAWARLANGPLELTPDHGHLAVDAVHVLLGHDRGAPPDPDRPAAAFGVILPAAGPSGAAPLAAPLTVHARRRSRALPSPYRRPID